MWSDSETDRDFLNFRTVSDTAAEMIIQAKGQPLSLGISGSWGVGKSSMIKLIQDSLRNHTEGKTVLFIDFNAWLYQGYDDARAALIDVMAQALAKQAESKKGATDKAKELLTRVDWFRLVKLGAGGVALAHGIPPFWLAPEAAALLDAAKGLTAEGVKSAAEKGEKALTEVKGVLKEKPKPHSPPREIHELREHFQKVIDELGVRVVVFVDDLDRCLPATSIATLEAIRLFLFLKDTAFVIAADEKMIRHAVRAHFGDVRIDDDLVTSYFDKLIQVPLRVPPLGTQEVRAYLMLLFIENSALAREVKDDLRTKICKQLGETWQGKRVDSEFVLPLITDWPKPLAEQLRSADRLAPFMASAKQISGNPRLIKRFLNTLYIRLAIARSQGVTVDEAVLVKMLLFERCAGEKAYAELVARINDDPDGKPRYLKLHEEKAAAGKPLEAVPPDWDPDFSARWLAMPPLLADKDLRPAVHVSRDLLPIITAADALSPEGAALVAALLKMTQPNNMFKARLSQLPRRETTLIFERLLSEARQVQDWSQLGILAACMAVVEAVPDLAERLSALLESVPVQQLKPAVVPMIRDAVWAPSVLKKWLESPGLPGPVKNAIEASKKASK